MPRAFDFAEEAEVTATPSQETAGLGAEHDATSRISSLSYDHPSRRVPLVPAYVNGLTVRVLEEEFPIEYSSFKAMKARERRKECTVSNELSTFKSYLLAMPRCPGDGFTVDKDPHDPEYARGKVRWATKREQANNRKATIMLPYQGEMLPLTVVAELTGQKPDTMRGRLRRGWTKEEVVAGHRSVTSNGGVARDWPSGTSHNAWEAPFQEWRRHKTLEGDSENATRPVFFLWIGQGMRNQALRELERDFPIYYSSENYDPEWDAETPVELAAHPAYLRERHIAAMLDECKTASLSTGERDLLRNLQSSLPKVTDPKRARAEMSNFRRRQIVQGGGMRAIYGPPKPQEDRAQLDKAENERGERLRNMLAKGLELSSTPRATPMQRQPRKTKTPNGDPTGLT